MRCTIKQFAARHAEYDQMSEEQIDTALRKRLDSIMQSKWTASSPSAVIWQCIVISYLLRSLQCNMDVWIPMVRQIVRAMYNEKMHGMKTWTSIVSTLLSAVMGHYILSAIGFEKNPVTIRVFAHGGIQLHVEKCDKVLKRISEKELYEALKVPLKHFMRAFAAGLSLDDAHLRHIVAMQSFCAVHTPLDLSWTEMTRCDNEDMQNYLQSIVTVRDNALVMNKKRQRLESTEKEARQVVA